MDYIDYLAEQQGLDPRLLDPGNFIALGVQHGKHRFLNREIVETNCFNYEFHARQMRNFVVNETRF